MDEARKSIEAMMKKQEEQMLFNIEFMEEAIKPVVPKKAFRMASNIWIADFDNKPDYDHAVSILKMETPTEACQMNVYEKKKRIAVIF